MLIVPLEVPATTLAGTSKGHHYYLGALVHRVVGQRKGDGNSSGPSVYKGHGSGYVRQVDTGLPHVGNGERNGQSTVRDFADGYL